MYYMFKNHLSFSMLFIFSINMAVSMLMFSTFEHSVDLMYRNVIRRRKEDCSKTQQLGVTCLAGYVAGAFGTFISNPADNIISSLYNKKADSVLQVALIYFKQADSCLVYTLKRSNCDCGF